MWRWIGRVLLGALLLLIVVAAGGYAYLRTMVNVPVRGMVALLAPGLVAPPDTDAQSLAPHLRLPPGFALTLFARNLRDARMLRSTRAGDLLVASPGKGALWLLAADMDKDGAADGVRLLMRGLDGPNGLDFHDRYLYIAEQGRVGRIGFDHVHGRVQGAYEVLIDGLPTGGNHWKKTLRFGPDGMLYLTIGSSCNVCIESDARRATMMRFAADGSGGTVIARGLRNSAGFDWRPSDGALFATDNGRDLLGDDFPPCELNQIEAGAFYGWPFVNGMGIADPDLGAGRTRERAAARNPVFGFNPHNAPIGILFPRHGGLGPAFHDAALVALHGSWNRAQKDGYRVVSLQWQPDGHIEARDFLSGLLDGDTVYGRPAELAEGDDGAIYVSDDYNGAVYRIVAHAGAHGVLADAGKPAEPLAADLALLDEPVDTPNAGNNVGAVTVGGSAAPARATDRAKLRGTGARLFAASGCLACHVAPTERADAPAAGKVQLRRLGDRYDDARLRDYLARPRPPMPPVLDASEREALASWLLATAPADPH